MMRIIGSTSCLTFCPMVCFVLKADEWSSTDTWDDWVVVQQANNWAVWCCQRGWGVSVWIRGMVEKCTFVWLSRMMYLSNKSASGGKGFMSTAVEISLYFATQWHKRWFKEAGMTNKVKPRMLKPSVPVPGPCWGMSWEATCRHKGSAVIIPLLFPLSLCSLAIRRPTPPRPNTGLLLLLSLLSQSPFTSSYPQSRSGWTLCGITGGPCRSSLGSVFVCGQLWIWRSEVNKFFWAGAQIKDWHSFTAPAPLCYKMSGSEAGGVCVVSNIYEGESSWDLL